MTKPIPKARIEQLMSFMLYVFGSATTSTSKGQVTMTQGCHGFHASVWSVSGTMTTRPLLSTALRQPGQRGETGDFWKRRAGNAITGSRVRGVDGETSSHPARVGIFLR